MAENKKNLVDSEDIAIDVDGNDISLRILKSIVPAAMSTSGKVDKQEYQTFQINYPTGYDKSNSFIIGYKESTYINNTLAYVVQNFGAAFYEGGSVVTDLVTIVYGDEYVEVTIPHSDSENQVKLDVLFMKIS